MKWCWSRLPGGVVTWPVYEGFQIGEEESGMARNAFNTFVPISVDSTARQSIIFDFYDLLAAVAAHGKMNGLGGRKLSRLAGWWAFEHTDDGKGFEGGYKCWTQAADASSHLFFAYLRSLSPEADPSMSLIERIPRSLQALLASTEYPPETPTLMQRSTPRVVMMVDSVSPTPFALLRRAKHFEYRDKDRVLREYSEFEDPVDALTDENKRVLYAISSTNSSAARSRHRTIAKPDESWSAFQNSGFSDLDSSALQKRPNNVNGSADPTNSALQSGPRSRNADHGRPTTPSWADFLSSGFAEDGKSPTTLLLPPDKVLPPIGSRAQTPRIPEGDDNLAPGELAAIKDVSLDDAFWWVWMTSLAGEEPAERKAVFGRCALIETSIMNGAWLIMEEQVKGASPDPIDGAYIAPKKGFFSTFTKRGKLGRKRSTSKKPNEQEREPFERVSSATPSKNSLAPDQQSKIKQAAAALKRQEPKDDESGARRGRYEDAHSTKTNSMLTLGLQNDAGPALKWMGAYDKNAIRAHYLGDAYAGTGVSREDILLPPNPSSQNVNGDGASSIAAPAPALSPGADRFPSDTTERELPAIPNEEPAINRTEIPGSAHAPEPTVLPPTTTETTKPETYVPTGSRGADRIRPPSAAPPPVPTTFDKEIGIEAPGSPNLNRVGRKPVPQTDDHPAFRENGVDNNSSPQTPTSPTTNIAAIAARKAMAETSPESANSGNAKSKKQGGHGGSGGLKKLFGRKKDNPNRQSMDVKSNAGNNLALPESGLGRRISLMRKKPSPATTPNHSQPELPQSNVQSNASELEGGPVMPESQGQFVHSDANVSQVDSEQLHAEREFSHFDQGPVDMPAITPQSSDHEIAAPQAQRQYQTQLAARMAPEHDTEEFATPMERDDPNDDAQSEATMESPQEVQPQDRWATIRENAARRAARAEARPSEEQSSQSRPSQSARTDDGETSGEESKF